MNSGKHTHIVLELNDKVAPDPSRTPIVRRRQVQKKTITFVFLPMGSVPISNCQLIAYTFARFTGYYDKRFIAAFVLLGEKAYCATPEGGVKTEPRDSVNITELLCDKDMPENLHAFLRTIKVNEKEYKEITIFCEKWASYRTTPQKTPVQDFRMQFGRFLPAFLSVSETCILPAEFILLIYFLTAEGKVAKENFKENPSFITLSRVYKLLTSNI